MNFTGKITTKKNVLVDKSKADAEAEFNSISLICIESLPVDGFMGHYDGASETFTINTKGEAFYNLNLKGFTEVTEDNGATHVEEDINKVCLYTGNQSLSFTNSVTNGNYGYSILDSIPVIGIGNSTQNISSNYDRGICDVNISKDDLIAKLAGASVTIDIKFFDANNNEIASTAISKTFTAADIQNTSPLINVADLHGASSISMNYSAGGVTFDNSEILLNIYPKDQDIDMKSKFNDLSKQNVCLNLTNDDNFISLGTVNRNVGISPQNTGNIYNGTILKLGTYSPQIKLNYLFGESDITRIYLIAMASSNGVSIQDLETNNYFKTVNFELNDSNSNTASFTADLTNFVFNGSLEPVSAANITLQNDFSNLDLHANLSGIASSSIYFEEFLWALNSDAALIFGRFLWSKITSSTYYNASDFSAIITRFGYSNFYRMICFNNYVYNRADLFDQDQDTNENALLYRLNLLAQFANLDILANRNSDYWYSAEDFSSGIQTAMQTFSDNIKNIANLAKDNNKAIRDIFDMDDSTVQSSLLTYANSIMEQIDIATYNRFGTALTEGEYNAVNYGASNIYSMTYSGYLNLDDETAKKYVTKMYSTLRQHTNIENVKYPESRINVLDVIFLPTNKDISTYKSVTNVEKLSFLKYIIEDDGVTYTYRHLYDLVLKNKVYFKDNKPTLILDFTGLDRTKIGVSTIYNKMFFASSIKLPSAKTTVTLTYLDENFNPIGSETGATLAYSELPENSGVSLIIPNETEDSVFYSYVAEVSLVDKSPFSSSNQVCYAQVSFDSIITSNFLGGSVSISKLYYTNNPEDASAINFYYKDALPASLLTDEKNLDSMVASYINIPVDLSSYQNEVDLFFSFAVAQALVDDANTAITFSIYSNQNTIIKEYFLSNNDFGTPVLVNGIYYYSGKFNLSDPTLNIMGGYPYEIVFLVTANEAVYEQNKDKLKVNFALWGDMLICNYIPSISGNQTYTTSPYIINTISVQDGTSSIKSNPGYNSYILSLGSNTSITLLSPESSMNVNTVLLNDSVDITSLKYSSTKGEDDKPLDLIISWTGNPENNKLTKKHNKMFNVSSLASSGSLTLKDYFTQLAFSNLNLNYGDIQYSLEVPSDGSTIYLRKTVDLSSLEEGEVATYEDYNTIIGIEGQTITGSGKTDDVLMASSGEGSNIFINNAKYTQMVGGSGNNLFKFIHNGDGYICSYGKYNEILIDKKSGTKIIDLTTNSFSLHNIEIEGVDLSSFFISANDIFCSAEVPPLNMELNADPSLEEDIDYIPAKALQYQMLYSAMDYQNPYSQLFSFNFPNALGSSSIPLFSTLSQDEGTSARFGFICNVTQSGSDFTFNVNFVDSANNINSVATLTQSYDMTKNVGYLYTEIKALDGQNAAIKITLLDDTTGALLKTSTSPSFKYTSAGNSLNLSADDLFFINHDRTLTAEDPSLNYSVYEALTSNTAFSDSELATVVKILNGTNLEPTEADYAVINRFISMNMEYLGGNYSSSVCLASALLLPSDNFTNVVISFSGESYNLRDLITAIRYKNQEFIGIAYSAKDKNSPLLQKGFTNFINMDASNGDQKLDRIGYSDLFQDTTTSSLKKGGK